MKNSGGEVKRLVAGKGYMDFIGCEKVPVFTIEPCVGGMSFFGIQMKWRVRYGDTAGEERVLVVLTGLAFLIADKEFIIQYSRRGKPGELAKGYAIYSI